MSVFAFKHFNIQQKHTPLKVGNDAMLLGSHARFSEAQKIIDIGCGTGVLSLMTAQTHPEAIIDGLEVHDDAVKDAQANFEAAPFSNVSKVFHQSLLDFETSDLYDGIICNPPFYNTSQLGIQDGKNTAKHVAELTPVVLAECFNKLCSTDAEAWMIWPFADQKILIEAFESQGWNLIERVTVFAKPNKANRVILKWGKEIVTQALEKEFIARGADNQFTDQYRALTKEFHNRPV